MKRKSPLVPIPVPKRRTRKPRAKKLKKVGPKTKCTPELIEQALTLAVSLVKDNAIYKAVGISHATWHDWKNHAATGREPYADFFKRLEETRGLKTIQLVNGIGNDPDWRAKAWLLERLDPQTYSLRHRIEHSGPGGQPLPATPTATPVQIIIQGGAPEDNPYLAPEEKN